MTVQQVLEYLGTDEVNGIPTTLTDNQMLGLYECIVSGWTLHDTARELGLTVSQLTGTIRALKRSTGVSTWQQLVRVFREAAE